jgi:flotillin
MIPLLQTDGGIGSLMTVAVVIVIAILFIPLLVSRFLTTVEAGVIRLVSWFGGVTRIYKGPGKAWEIPLLTTATSIPSQAINIDLDITDQTADRDAEGRPKPIKVNVQASAIVSIGDTQEMILTAANRFFSKAPQEQQNTLTDLLTSSGRRAVNLLWHDQLYSSVDGGAAPLAVASPSDEDEDPLAIIIKRQCSRELHDLGLQFNSLNIKAVVSEVAEARRRQSAVEAKANADIVQAEQERRAREAQLAAQQVISDRERELERRRAENAAQVAQAEAAKQDALALQRTAELKATQIAQATADAERIRLEAKGQADADAVRLETVAAGEAKKVRLLADAQAEAIRKVNEAVREGGQAYLVLRQLEMLPTIVPSISEALARARMVTVSTDGNGAPGQTTSHISEVIQTVLAAQLLNGALTPDTPKPRLERPTPTAEPDPLEALRPPARPTGGSRNS